MFGLDKTSDFCYMAAVMGFISVTIGAFNIVVFSYTIPFLLMVIIICSILLVSVGNELSEMGK